MKSCSCAAMTFGSFLPMALRSTSARAMEKPATVEAMVMTCSW